ncbi:MAG TPA: hypothetical protein VN493_27025 [Thermoanaerobaculia bacterium]|nr:hypothetical protein [Thermoanaerobaculia bacterium]
MKTKLCVAVLGMLLLGAVSANALVCQWCDCTMACSRACRDTSTWLITTCGAYGGLCATAPECLQLAAENPLMQELPTSDKAPVCSEQAPALQPPVTLP